MGTGRKTSRKHRGNLAGTLGGGRSKAEEFTLLDVSEFIGLPAVPDLLGRVLTCAIVGVDVLALAGTNPVGRLPEGRPRSISVDEARLLVIRAEITDGQAIVRVRIA